jgi:hypothetical protein
LQSQKDAVERTKFLKHDDLEQQRAFEGNGRSRAAHNAASSHRLRFQPLERMLTFGVDADPVPNKASASFFDGMSERLKRLYDV